MGFPWDADTCLEAAVAGHVPMFALCRESGCPRDAETTAFAALGGRLAALQWAHEHGCEWSFNTALFAAHKRALRVSEIRSRKLVLLDPHLCREEGKTHPEIVAWIDEYVANQQKL